MEFHSDLFRLGIFISRCLKGGHSI